MVELHKRGGSWAGSQEQMCSRHPAETRVGPGTVGLRRGSRGKGGQGTVPSPGEEKGEGRTKWGGTRQVGRRVKGNVPSEAISHPSATASCCKFYFSFKNLGPLYDIPATQNE